MKKIARRLLATLLIGVLMTGIAVNHRESGEEKDTYSYSVWFAGMPLSFDLDKVTPYTNSPYNSSYQKQLNKNSNPTEQDFLDWHNYDLQRIKEQGLDFGKANSDWALAGDWYMLQNNKWRTYEYEEKNIHSLMDYKAMRDRGYIMTPETSFYWGIKTPSNININEGDKKKITVKNAPSVYDKLIRSEEHTISPDGIHPGPLVKEGVYFVSPKWTSSNEDVAEVNNKGVVTAIGAGKTKVRVKYDIWLTNQNLKFKDDYPVAHKNFDSSQNWNTYASDFGTEDNYGRGIADRYSVIRTINVTVK